MPSITQFIETLAKTGNKSNQKAQAKSENEANAEIDALLAAVLPGLPDDLKHFLHEHPEIDAALLGDIKTVLAAEKDAIDSTPPDRLTTLGLDDKILPDSIFGQLVSHLARKYIADHPSLLQSFAPFLWKNPAQEHLAEIVSIPISKLISMTANKLEHQKLVATRVANIAKFCDIENAEPHQASESASMRNAFLNFKEEQQKFEDNVEFAIDLHLSPKPEDKVKLTAFLKTMETFTLWGRVKKPALSKQIKAILATAEKSGKDAAQAENRNMNMKYIKETASGLGYSKEQADSLSQWAQDLRISTEVMSNYIDAYNQSGPGKLKHALAVEGIARPFRQAFGEHLKVDPLRMAIIDMLTACIGHINGNNGSGDATD